MKKESKTNFTKLTQKKGISLIVLIVTIIVIIILAAAVILTLSKNNPIESAREATFKEDVRAFQDELALSISKEYTEKQGQRDKKITASDFDTIKKYIPSFTEKYKGKFVIENDKLVGTDALTEKEKEWSQNITIKANQESEVITNYTVEEIEANEYLYAIGATKREYVVAKFNEDYTEVVITKNGEESDGIIMEFYPGNSSPMSNNKATLKTAVIKKGITKINGGFAGYSTFLTCVNLTDVTIPDSVTYIGQAAFQGCRNLTSITIPESVTSIGGTAFASCSSLTSITIPESVTSIGGSAFDDCSSLTSVKLSKGLTSIGGGAFSNCSSLINIIIPDSVTEFGQSTFARCSSLTNITIPDSVIHIGSDSFLNTPWYENQPDGIVYAGKVAYKYKGECPKDIVIADGIKSITQGAFKDCTNLTNITIPNSVISIGDGAFLNCGNLTSVKLPENLTNIEANTFYGCRNLTDITIPNKLTSIGRSAFNSEKIQSVTIPESVTSIDERAFDNCHGLTINCRVGSKPTGWADNWALFPEEIVWGYTGE